MEEWDLGQEAAAVQVLETAGVIFQSGKSGKVRAANIPEACDVAVVDWSLFSRLGYLARFEAPNTRVRDEHVASLVHLKRLKQIDLVGAEQVTDTCRQYFQSLPKLELLKVTGTAMTIDVIRQMRKEMIATRIVYL